MFVPNILFPIFDNILNRVELMFLNVGTQGKEEIGK